MWRTRPIAILGAILTLGAVGGAQSKSDANTYTWSAELVSLDSSAMTMTVKARCAYPETVSELKQFKPGDRVWILWSGIHDYSDAVRQVRRADANAKIAEDLVMPAELVSTEAPNQYVTIRLKVPPTSVAALKDVKPSEWVTITSRHRPSTDAEAVISVRPYNSVPSEHSHVSANMREHREVLTA